MDRGEERPLGVTDGLSDLSASTDDADVLIVAPISGGSLLKFNLEAKKVERAETV